MRRLSRFNLSIFSTSSVKCMAGFKLILAVIIPRGMGSKVQIGYLALHGVQGQCIVHVHVHL